MDRIENDLIQQKLNKIILFNEQINIEEKNSESLVQELLANFKSEFSNKTYGTMSTLINNFISLAEELIGPNVNLELGKLPVYLSDTMYIIDHAYDGSVFQEPIILSENENKIVFKENHPFFKTDVFYYTDNRSTQIDVFYHAVTLKLLGYKEKHRDYVLTKKSNNYLQISQSLKDRLLLIGYDTKYIDIGDIFMKNTKTYTDVNENYFNILDNLIREHIFKMKSIVDKFASIIYKVKNFIEDTTEEQIFLQTTQHINLIINKYNKTIRNLNIGENNKAFDNWNFIRNYLSYEKINWSETNIRVTENLFINSDIINYYDVTSSIIMYYLISQLINIVNSNTERINKINIIQLIIELVNYVFGLYNIDAYKNLMEIKRFNYLLNGSDMLIDLLRKGQGLDQSKQIEDQLDDVNPDIDEIAPTDEQQEELDDLKEEADALDVETEYYEDENEDYAEGGDYDV